MKYTGREDRALVIKKDVSPKFVRCWISASQSVSLKFEKRCLEIKPLSTLQSTLPNAYSVGNQIMLKEPLHLVSPSRWKLKAEAIVWGMGFLYPPEQVNESFFPLCLPTTPGPSQCCFHLARFHEWVFEFTLPLPV